MYKSDHGEFPKSDWIEKIKPYWGDGIEKYLCCPACSNCENGRTSYVLVLYDELPADNNDIFLLLELQESVLYEQAVMTVEEVLCDIELDEKKQRIGCSNRYPNAPHSSKQDGSINVINKGSLNKNVFKKSLGKNIENNHNN
jgi:hypothetical protein